MAEGEKGARDRRTRRARRTSQAFGVVNLVSAVLVALGVFGGLPARWWVVDVPAALVVALLGVSGAGLVFRARRADSLARVASFVVLAAGLSLVAALVLTASGLSGLYGPIGKGGAIIMILVVALAVPYLVVLPAAELLWLGPRRMASVPPSTGPEPEKVDPEGA